jgi:hypothetical protein
MKKKTCQDSLSLNRDLDSGPPEYEACLCFINDAVSLARNQAVSHRLLAAEARVRARVSPCGICDGQSGTRAISSPSSDRPYDWNNTHLWNVRLLQRKCTALCHRRLCYIYACSCCPFLTKTEIRKHILAKLTNKSVQLFWSCYICAAGRRDFNRRTAEMCTRLKTASEIGIHNKIRGQRNLIAKFLEDSKLLPLTRQSFMDLGLLDDPPPDIPITCFLPPCLYFQ